MWWLGLLAPVPPAWLCFDLGALAWPLVPSSGLEGWDTPLNGVLLPLQDGQPVRTLSYGEWRRGMIWCGSCPLPLTLEPLSPLLFCSVQLLLEAHRSYLITETQGYVQRRPS